jgi:hypothetical protein
MPFDASVADDFIVENYENYFAHHEQMLHFPECFQNGIFLLPRYSTFSFWTSLNPFLHMLFLDLSTRKESDQKYVNLGKRKMPFLNLIENIVENGAFAM